MEYTNEESWVSTSEGAEITGYNQIYVQRLARDNWNLPEAERLIRVRKRSRGYDLWLPDLMRYMNESGNGPQSHTSKNEQLDK
jgi:hypothetical protein